jgi:DNA-binding transcriptional LysR family regulator
MITETLELTVFHCVVKHSSYAKAAEELTLSPSGVSRIVSRLEERLGARLVQRTTRKLSLTEAGAAFHARTVQIMVDLADAESEAQETALRPRGNLRVSAPVVFGQLFVAPLLDALLLRFPELTIELSLTDRFVDLIDEGMDLAIRIGSLSDSRLIARRLCTNHRVLVASSSYLERRGIPSHPSELVNHDCVLFTSFARPREWKLLGPEGPVSVSVSGRMASNNADVVASSAKRGHGITVGATLVVGPALRSGELVRVLSDWEFENSAIFALYPSARQLSTKVRATVDFLAEHLKDPPSWDRLLVGVPGFGQGFHGS